MPKLRRIVADAVDRAHAWRLWARFRRDPAAVLGPRARPGLTLTRQELARLTIGGWYHDFATLGFATRFMDRKHQVNQACKQGPLCRLIDMAIELCRREDRPCRGVELFCADGFYANYAVLHGATAMLGLDRDAASIADATLIARVLGHEDRVRFEVADVFDLRQDHDLCVCAGGLYHIADPPGLLGLLRARIRRALVVQTVVSLEHEGPAYFEAPAPGWTWGCRFSHARLLAMAQEAGWTVLEQYRNELAANRRPQDRGSAYLLCVPAAAPP